MQVERLLAGFVVFGVVCFGPKAHAGDPLLDVVSARPCSSIAGDRVGASGNCAALSAPRGLSVDLVASPGSMDFKLPPEVARPDGTSGKPTGIHVDGLMLYNGALAPEVWRLNAGDVLKVKLTNKLPSGEDGATNLHTHGLLVSPDLDVTADGKASEPVGDTVYVCTVPQGETAGGPSAQHCKLHASYFGADPSQMHYEVVLPANHPEGLFWYHPHLHMSARTQVGSGLAGLIYIKGQDTKVSGGARSSQGAEPPERFLMLKDIQIGGIDVSSPDSIKASFLPVEKHDSEICGDRTGATPPWQGACFGKDSDGHDAGWLFTVNGQVFPRIEVGASTTEVWRIGNTSADMTYDLALVEDGTGRPLRLQVLARDGVAATVNGGTGPLMVERVLLMPGSRIEVGVDRKTAEGLLGDAAPLTARLRSYGFFTGGAAGFGDAWPAVDLAQVVFAAAAPTSAPLPAATSSLLKADRNRLVLTNAPAPPSYAPLVVSPWVPSPDAEKAIAPSHANRVVGTPAVHEMEMRMEGNGIAATDPANVATDDCKPLASNQERIIALAIDKSGGAEKFEIGAARWDQDRPQDWNAAVDRALAGARSFGDHSVVLCGHAGHSEIWTIVNRPKRLADGSFDPNGNNETHNFHIHQMKFEVLDVTDPSGRVSPPTGGPGAGRRVDSFPVPIGGALRIKVTYTKQQVGGRFVLHCHILEHEDKGMMAELQVMSH